MTVKLQPHEMLSRTERKEKGQNLRKQVPRSSHGDWTPAADRPDPLDLLQAQDAGRLQHLLPIKYGRMVASPFAFLRGSAGVMAADLANTPVTGIQAVLCGDAHIANFGIFATPERRMTFDINDFDESFAGPWEWDLKRLAASVVVAGKDNGFSEKWCEELAESTAETYREAMGRFAEMHTLDVWYYHVDTDALLGAFEKTSKQAEKAVAKTVKKARTKTHEQTMEKLTTIKDGRRRIISDPPLLVPMEEMIAGQLTESDRISLTEEGVENAWTQYLDSLPVERRFLLLRYRLTDAALRVGGVGSVGTRCIIVLLEGGADNDALILQLKEAGPSALAAYLPEKQRYIKQEAQRVVTGQHLMQATSDIFLGWHTSELTNRNYYWRQLKDMKGSFDVAALDEQGLQTYVKVCVLCLARAHARTSDAAAIHGYLGSSDTFSRAITKFAVAYADQTKKDHQALRDAINSGRIVAEENI